MNMSLQLKKIYRLLLGKSIHKHWNIPDLKPYRMDVKDFEEALANGAGIPMKDSAREKLERKEAGLLTGLKAEILRTGMTIEQERLL